MPRSISLNSVYLQTLEKKLNAIEEKFSSDIPYWEWRNTQFNKWTVKSIDISANRSSRGHVAQCKIKLHYDDEFEYQPRLWYNKKKGKIRSVFIPLNRIEITPPPVTKLADDKVMPPSKNVGVAGFRVYYRNGQMRIGKEMDTSSVSAERTHVAIGEGSTPNPFRNSRKPYPTTPRSPTLPIRVTAPEGVESSEIYENIDEYNGEFIAAVSDVVSEGVIDSLVGGYISFVKPFVDYNQKTPKPKKHSTRPKKQVSKTENHEEYVEILG